MERGKLRTALAETARSLRAGLAWWALAKLFAMYPPMVEEITAMVLKATAKKETP